MHVLPVVSFQRIIMYMVYRFQLCSSNLQPSNFRLPCQSHSFSDCVAPPIDHLGMTIYFHGNISRKPIIAIWLIDPLKFFAMLFLPIHDHCLEFSLSPLLVLLLYLVLISAKLDTSKVMTQSWTNEYPWICDFKALANSHPFAIRGKHY